MEDIQFTQPTFCEEETSSKVARNLNKIFGRDLKNLPKAKELLEDINSKRMELEQRLLFATNEAPDKLSKALCNADRMVQSNEQMDTEISTLNKEVLQLKEREEIFPLLSEISPSLETIQKAERVKAYFKWISAIQELSSQIESSIKLGNDEQALIHFGRLKESAEIITDSQCINLKEYTCRMVLHWHKILFDRLEREFESVMKAVKWPFTQSSPSLKPIPPSIEVIQRLEAVIINLLQLSVSECIKSSVREDPASFTEDLEDKSAPSFISNFSVSSVPVQMLLKPLEVRFMYHFSGEKATNSRRNPEWYLTQILKWISTHEPFIETYIQPILNKTDANRFVAKNEFTKGLLRLVVLKLASDLLEIQGDEDLFCQTVQETLNFERELRLGIGYPSSQPTVLSILTLASVFKTWISIERKFALELMDEFVASANAWHSEEEGAICQCGEQLILLLQGITERYKPLSQPGHRLQFLHLQLELLDDFRVRILQLTKSELSEPLKSNYIPILNTVHYLVSTISDWADIPFFIEMQYFKEKFSSVEEKMQSPSNYLKKKIDVDICNDAKAEEHFSQSEILSKSMSSLGVLTKEIHSMKDTESVFQPTLSLYSHIETEMLSVVSQHVLTEVRARSLPYRKDKWFFTPSETSAEPIAHEISPSLCPLLEALVKHLLLLRQSLASPLFSRFWREVAAALNKFIYEEVILQNTFSKYGSAQLSYDMTKAFFPIFGEFTVKPESSFPLVKESLLLLTLPRPTALLLRDTLKQSESGREFYSQSMSPLKALEERGIFQLNVQEAQIILNIRTNMNVL